MHEPVLPAAPSDWQLVATDGAGPFITRATYRRPDGVEVEWTSRRHRKGQGLRLLGTPPSAAAPAVVGGSACSATDVVDLGFVRRRLDLLRLGVLPAYLDVVSPRTDGLTFFIGSIFFTCRVLPEACRGSRKPGRLTGRADPPPPIPRSRLAATVDRLVGHRDPADRHCLLQRDDISRPVRQRSVSQENRLVWRPDVVGSICFLVASTSPGRRLPQRAPAIRELSWWIVALNLLGLVPSGSPPSART